MNDARIARKYLSKMSNAKEKGIIFTLNLVSFRNIMRAKKCYFTGLPLTCDTISIDRVDCNKGYVKGNVVACHTSFNSLKGNLENPTTNLNLALAIKGLQKWKQRA